MNKLAYIKYSQKEANQKIWNSLMDKYELLKKKNSFLAHLWVPLACILFGFVAIFSWISFLTLLFKDIQFTPHYMRTVIKYNNMSKEEEKEYLDNQFSEYKNRVSYGNLSTEKQSQINTTFDLLFKVNTDKFDKIPVKKGEILRITIHNNSMMRHPMHLHGFDFRVINGKGEKSPLKNVIDIMPMETDTIEFLANEEGDWFFHCHILYHMMGGMNRVFAVDDYQNPYLPNKKQAYNKLQRESNMPHFMAQNDFATNGNDGEAMVQNARWSLGTEWRLGYNDMHGYEVETHLGRYIGKTQWLMPFIGFDWRYRKMGMDEHETNLFGQKNEKDTRRAFSLGFMYTLPMLVNFQAEVYHDGIVRLSLMREDIPISKRLRAGFMVNTDMEYMADLKYIINKNMGIRTHYDSDMGFGVGLVMNY